MSVIKVLRDLNGLFNYSTDENPTSQQDYQKAVKNWVKTIVSLVDAVMWQPETEYVVGDTVKTPSLSKDTVLYCLEAGTTGAAGVTDGAITLVAVLFLTFRLVLTNRLLCQASMVYRPP